jgi:hypothetical protein
MISACGEWHERGFQCLKSPLLFNLSVTPHGVPDHWVPYGDGATDFALMRSRFLRRNGLNLKKFLGLAAGLAYGATLASAGLIITPTFDSSITTDPNAAAIEGVINSAIATYESTFSNPINVKIYFQEGGGLGQSEAFSYFNGYTSFYDGLVATNANPAAIAGLNANGGDADTHGGLEPVLGLDGIAVKSADGRAVGIASDVATCIPTATGAGTLGGNVPNSCSTGTGAGAVDGIISLNTQITNPGSPGAVADFPLLAATEHEIDEVMGLGSSLENCSDTSSPSCTVGSVYNSTGTFIEPEDLFRYNSAGARTLSTTCSATPFDTDLSTQPSAFFAYGSGTGDIAQFNNDCNGADFGDWQSSPLPNGTNPQVQDAFTGPGPGPTLGTSEIDALTAVGYKLTSTTSTPEPGTMILFGAGVSVLALVYRRRRA